MLSQGAACEVNISACGRNAEVSSSDPAQLYSVMQGFPGYSQIKQDGKLIHLYFPVNTARLEDVNRFCFEKGIALNLLLVKKKSLETKFFELTND